MDKETELLLAELSPNEITDLEKEFENLCDLSFDNSSRGNSIVSDDTTVGLFSNNNNNSKTDSKAAVPSSHGDRAAIHTKHSSKGARENFSQKLLSANSDIVVSHDPVVEQRNGGSKLKSADTPMKHSTSASSRAERRRQFYTKRLEPNSQSLDEGSKLEEAIAVCDSKPARRFSETDDNTEVSRARKLQADVRRSKLNARDGTSDQSADSSQRFRLTRRRISRDDDPSKSRLTSRRLNSTDDPEPSADVAQALDKSTKSDQTESQGQINYTSRPAPRLSSRDSRSSDKEPMMTRSRALRNLDESKETTEELKTTSDSGRRLAPEREVGTRPESKKTGRLTTRSNYSPSRETASEKKERTQTGTTSAADRRRSPARRDSPRSTPDREIGKTSSDKPMTRALRTNVEDGKRAGRGSPRSTPDRELRKTGDKTSTGTTRTSSGDRASQARTTRTRVTPELESGTTVPERRPVHRDTTDSKSPTMDRATGTKRSTEESQNARRLRRHQDNALKSSDNKKSDSSGEERQALLSSMKRNLDELNDLRKGAKAAQRQFKSDSSGDDKRVLRLRRTKEQEPVHPPRTKSDSSGEDGKVKPGLSRTARDGRGKKTGVDTKLVTGAKVEAKVVTPDSKLVAPQMKFAKTEPKLVAPEPKLVAPEPKLVTPELKLVKPEPIKTRASSTLAASRIACVRLAETNLSDGTSTDTSNNDTEPTESDTSVLTKAMANVSLSDTIAPVPYDISPVDEERSSREETPNRASSEEKSTESDRSDIVLPKRLPRTEITSFNTEPSIKTSFCVDYLAAKRESLPSTDQDSPRRHSLLVGEDKPRSKGIRRSGSLRTVKDRSWIRDQSDDVSSRNVEMPRRDSLRNVDQSWIRDQVDSGSRQGSLLRDEQTRKDSYTSEESVVLRNARRGSEEDRPQSVDAEIDEVRLREGRRAEDERTRLSIADKLKLFTDSPQEKSPQKIIRRKQRYKAQRFKTQPITMDEVEKAGKITPRPVSLVVTDKDTKLLERALGNRDSSEKELQQGPKIEVPKEDSIEFFSNSDATPIKIAVDSDAFDDVFLCSQDLLDIRRRPKPKRRAATKAVNPIKALRARDDLQDAYTEMKVVDVKKIQRQQIDSKTGYAEAALQGLASIENFNKVSLKKATENKKSTDPYSSLMLVLIKGRHDVQIRLVEPKASSLCSGDCYVLVTPERIYCWLGKYGNIIEKAKAQEFANLILKHKDMGFKGDKDVLVIEETASERKKEFWELIGGIGKYRTTETDDELYEFRLCEMNIVYRLETDTLVPDAAWCGQPLKFEMLADHSRVLVFDFGTELYVWNGPKCSFEDRKRGLKLAKQVWENGVEYKETPNPFLPFVEDNGGFNGSRPEWCLFGKINQNMETQLFKEKFFDWPDSNKIISVKVEKKEEKEQVELTPCDVGNMLMPNREPVTLLLEGTHVGRGRFWSDKKDEFVSKDFDIVTIKVTCWLVQEYDHHIMDDDSYGQFHDADTYVVRWQYMVMPSVKALRGGSSRQSLTGRERCAYFFWQGNDSSINEKGASALMTVELDDERGPQVRVVQGQEPPAFTQLFDGKMIVHLGKRGTKSGPWKLFVIRNEIPCEVYLLEVPCLYASLRSRASFVLLNTESGLNFVWHGSKSPQKTRESTMEISKGLTSSFPNELGMTVPISDPTEIHEGNERRKFFLAFKDIDTHTAALTKDLSFKSANAPDYKMSPRLFHLTSVSGVFEALEIVNPSRSEHISPLPFTQEQLYDPCVQPALFIMDIGTKVYVWQGWWPDGFDEGENVQTGSARARFSKERRLALETADIYCTRKEIKGELIVAGYESEKFTDLFPMWKVLPEAETNNREDFERLEGMFGIKELLSSYEKKVYTYSELVLKPEGIDPSKIEAYLTDEEFELVFRMTKDSFYLLPAWKQISMRKSAGLF